MELTETKCRMLLEAEAVGHMGTLSEGEPYVTPLSYVIVGDEIRFRTAPGRRLQSIAESPRVCIEVSRTVADTGAWESVIVWGTARILDDPAGEAETVQKLLAKYKDTAESVLAFSAPQFAAAEPVVVAVTIEHMSGRSSGSGLGPGLRPGRL